VEPDENSLTLESSLGKCCFESIAKLHVYNIYPQNALKVDFEYNVSGGLG
jgi:hypothetical protein